MQTEWINFATNEMPSAPGAPAWPAYDAATDPFLVLDETVSTGAGVRTAQCGFWDSIDDQQTTSTAPPARLEAAKRGVGAQAAAPGDQLTRSIRAGTCLCHGVPTNGSRSSSAVSSFGATPVAATPAPVG